MIDASPIPVKKNRDTLHGNNNRLAVGSSGVCVSRPTRTPPLLPCVGKAKRLPISLSVSSNYSKLLYSFILFQHMNVYFIGEFIMYNKNA